MRFQERDRDTCREIGVDRSFRGGISRAALAAERTLDGKTFRARCIGGALGWGWLVGALALPLISSGCANSAPETVGRSVDVEVADFYVPANFEFVNGETYDQAADLRSWTGQYRGKKQIAEVEPSYIERMPTFGWRLHEIRRGSTAGDKLLTFFKGDERAIVHLHRQFYSPYGGFATIVDAKIGPRPVESFDADSELQALKNGTYQNKTPPAATDGAATTAKAKIPAARAGTASASEARGAPASYTEEPDASGAQEDVEPAGDTQRGDTQRSDTESDEAAPESSDIEDEGVLVNDHAHE
jgi:hypothetical protein